MQNMPFTSPISLAGPVNRQALQIHFELTATTGRLINAHYMNSADCRIDKAKTGIKRMRSIQKDIVECNRNGKTASKVLERSLNGVGINSHTSQGEGGDAIPASHRAYRDRFKRQNRIGIG